MLKKIQHLLRLLKGNLQNGAKLDALYCLHTAGHKSAKVNIGQLQAAHNQQKKQISRLSEVEFQVFSQFGDDGIIQWLVGQLAFPKKTFIEFGVENYRESNTRFLLVNNYWSGLVIDGSAANIATISTEQIHSFYDLQAIASFITAENINELLAKSRFKKEVGILSIDIDGNDYWVWKAIRDIEPVVIICEYNSLFGFEHPYTIPYKADFVRGVETPFNFYGISLLSAIDLAAERGYTFIGCNSAGNNAYFIRNNYLPQLGIGGATAREAYVFASFTEAFDAPKREWLRGADKIRFIHGQQVYNTRTGQTERFDAESVIRSLNEANKITRL